MKKILRRIIIILPAVLLQVLFLLLIHHVFVNFGPIVTQIIFLLISIYSACVILYLVSKTDEDTYKILWIITICILPVFGSIVYFFFGDKSTSKGLKENITNAKNALNYSFNSTADFENVIKKEDKDTYNIFNTINEISNYPILKNEGTKYYELGEKMFEDMLIELKKAQKYIFCEYFIIDNGKFWSSLVDIMAEKVKEGVDVRVIYDDLGSINTFDGEDSKALIQKGIKCMAFNPLLNIQPQLNNRDHRKILSIDGEIAFCGGVNIADEYINERVKYGHWKDIGYKVKGENARVFSCMFADFWNAYNDDKIPGKWLEANENSSQNNVKNNDGYVLSFYDSPYNDLHISNIYFSNLLYGAKDYVWIYTPYLILGSTLMQALITAGLKGVDVRIITPGVADKKLINMVTKSYYRDLILSGVRIFEYTPGFVHAKAGVCDDVLANIGTVNLDYRSLFLHFECQSIFYKSSMLNAIKSDMEETLKKCHEVTAEETEKNWFGNLIDSILRVFAPLL